MQQSANLPGVEEKIEPSPDLHDGAAVSPDEPVVELGYVECRTCGECSPKGRTDSHGDESPLYDWATEHRQTTKHSHFYRWTLTRHTMRLLAL